LWSFVGGGRAENRDHLHVGDSSYAVYRRTSAYTSGEHHPAARSTTVTVKITHRTVSVDTIEEDGRRFEVEQQPISCLDPVVETLPDGTAIVGYLSEDEDISNPLEDRDASGWVVSFHRGAPKEHYARAMELLALDTDGNTIEGARRSPMAVVLDCYSHGGEAWAINGSAESAMWPDQQWDVAHGGGVWIPDPACEDHIIDMAFGRQMPTRASVQHVQGDEFPRRFVFKSHEETYRAAAKAMGFEVNEEQLIQDIRAESIACAGQALEEYNAWLAGECYVVCVQVFDKDNQPVGDPDSCGGYIGRESTLKELAEQVQMEKERILETPKKPQSSPAPEE
jgi:hypothetical protein